MLSITTTATSRYASEPVMIYARCVEVEGSHAGLACNHEVYLQIAQTLARETAGR